MPIYEYQGQQYELKETDPQKAKARILSYLGTQQAPAPQEKRDTTLAEDFQIGLGNAGATAVRGAGLIAGGIPGRLGWTDFGDSVFEGSENLAKSVEDYWTPQDAEQKTFGGKLAGLLSTLPVQMAAMPFSPADTGRRMINNGEDLETAKTGTLLDTAGNIAGIAAPASVGGNILTRALTGGAMNAAQDTAVRSAIAGIAQQDKTKQEFGPTWETAGLSGALGAGMGAMIPNVKGKPRPELEQKPPGWANISPTMSDFEFGLLKTHYKVISERIAGITDELNTANKLIEDGVTDPEFLKYVEDLETKLKSAQASFEETESLIRNPLHTTKQQKTDLEAVKDIATRNRTQRLRTLREANKQQQQETNETTIPNRADEADAALATLDGLTSEAPVKKSPLEIATLKIQQAAGNIGLVRRYRAEAELRLADLPPREAEAGRPGSEFSALRDALETEIKAYDELEAGLTGKQQAEPTVDTPRTDVEPPRIDEQVADDTNQPPLAIEERQRLIAEARAKSETQKQQPSTGFDGLPPDPLNAGKRDRVDRSVGVATPETTNRDYILAPSKAPFVEKMRALDTPLTPNQLVAVARSQINALEGMLDRVNQQLIAYSKGELPSGAFDERDAINLRSQIEDSLDHWEGVKEHGESGRSIDDAFAVGKPATKETVVVKYGAVQDILDTVISPLTAMLDNRNLFRTTKDTKLHFDPRIPTTLQNVFVHFLDKLGLSKSEQIFFVVDNKLTGSKLGEHDIYGNSAIIKISPDNIQTAALKHQAKDPNLFAKFAELPKNIWNRYMEARVAAHEIGHHLMLKWIHKHSFDTGVMKSAEVERLMSEFVSWRKNTNETQRYDSSPYIRDNFAEFFAEEVSRTLMNRHLFDAISKGNLLSSLVKLVKTTQEYFKELGVANRKHDGDTFVSDLVEDIIARNKADFGKVWDAYELAKHNKMVSAMPTLEDVAVKLGESQGELLPEYKIFADSATKAASVSDNYSVSTIHKLMSKAFGKTAIAHIFKDNPFIQQAYWFTRDGALEASKISNTIWHGIESFADFNKRSIFTKFSRVKDGSSPYHTVRQATDDEMFRIMKIFERGFDEALPYKESLEKYGSHLTEKEKTTFNTLANMFKEQYEASVNLQKKLNKKHELPYREGWFPSVRKGEYIVNIGFGGEISRRQHFATKEAALAFIDKIKQQKPKLVEISEPLPARTETVMDNSVMVDTIKELLKRKYPNAGAQITRDIDVMLENMAKRGGKIGKHHEYREGITGYKGSELFFSEKEQGRSFKEAIINSVDDYAGSLRSMVIRTKLLPMLENPNIDANTKMLIQQMYDTTQGLNKDIASGLDEFAVETVEKAVRKMANSIPFADYKGKNAALSTFANNSLELLYLMKIMAKPAFIMAQLISPLQSLRHMSHDTGVLRPWMSFGKGMFDLVSGNAELKRAMYETRNETHTFEPQFIDALHLTEKQNFIIEGLKDWVLLRKPAEFADTMSRVMTFAGMFAHYRGLGKSYSEAKRLAQHGTDATMVQYNRAETAPMFEHFGGIGAQMRPLQTYPTAALGNLIGDIKRMSPTEIKTWAPMINYALTTMILGGVMSLMFIQEYEGIRKLIANVAPEYAPPSVVDIMTQDPTFMDRVETDPDIMQKATLLGLPAALTGIDVASSLRTNEAFFTVLAGIILGQKEWYEAMPIMSLYGDFASGMSTLVQNKVGEGVPAAELNKAIGKVFPAGIAGYAAKEKVGVNETKVFGDQTGMKIGGTDGEATSPRTTLDKVAGYMGTKTTDDRIDLMVNMRKRELDKKRTEQIKRNAILFTETGKDVFLNRLIATEASEKEIENAIGNQLYKKLVDQKQRYYTTKQGTVNPRKAERALDYNEIGQ